MSFNSLSKSQQVAYSATNVRFGLNADEVTHGPVSIPEGKNVIFSSDPFESDVPPKLITINSIQEYKKVTGFDTGEINKQSTPHNLDNIKVSALSMFSEGKTSPKTKFSAEDYTPEDKRMLRQAAQEFVVGDAARMEAMTDHINAAFFPTKVAMFSSTDPLVIDGTVTVKPSSDGKAVVWNYPSVTMGPSGKIIQETDFVLNTDVLQSSTGDNGDIIIDNTPPPYSSPANDGSTSPTPSKAGGGTSGEQAQSTSKGCPWYCKKEPGTGDTGKKGPDGGNGTPGGKGGTMSALTMTITKTVTGKVLISASGGNGQDGGKGGKGTDGGPGGDPGTKPANACTAASAGAQGPGGKGGMGGNGGDGGDVGAIIIKIPYDMQQPQSVIIPTGGRPGNAGSPGQGGTGAPSGGPGDANTHIAKPSPAPSITWQRLPPTV